MATSSKTQTTDFTLDVIGRYLCNGLDEALRSTDTTQRPDARPFDILVIGGGSFGAAFAQHAFANDAARSHRILVLDAGRYVLPEHVQNLPMLGLNVPLPTETDPGVARNEVWGLPWRSDVPKGFPGLAYCLGGRSLFFGGWSPELLDAETTRWPQVVLDDLRNAQPDGTPGYFRQASEQIGVTETNDFIHGPLHTALRQRLFDGIAASKITDAIPLAQLPLHLDDIPPAERDLNKLEAPLAVQARPPRSGYFPFNKFNSATLLIDAARAAQYDAAGDDVEKRLMVVPNCHVKRLITALEGGSRRVVAVETNADPNPIPVPAGGAVVIALGTIESTRLALTSFPDLANGDLVGRNLMAHLRSNLTIRIPRSALPANLPSELQASALFVKGRHDVGTAPTTDVRHFHLQITAAGLNKPTNDTEPELFKKIPDIDTLAAFHTANDLHVVMTIRGIGEMEPQNPSSRVTASGELDEFSFPRAFVSLKPTAKDTLLWDAMDKAADEAALVFANGSAYEVLTANGYQAVAAGQLASTVAPVLARRDAHGTTHHEAGTLWMGDNSTTSVTNLDGRFHGVSNAYVAGPALFPTIGSPNPMLTGVALARRLGDHLAPKPTPYSAPDGFTALFDGFSTDRWRMAGGGKFIVVNGALESVPAGGPLGLYWCTTPTPADFVLKLEWRRTSESDNSGVFVRFPHPDSKGYDNTAWVGVHFGFEVQIDEAGQPDGLEIHKTGAVYDQPVQALTRQAAKPVGEWNEFEIRVEGQTYTVSLNGTQVTRFVFTTGSDAAHPDRGLPSTLNVPRFIGLQAHTGRVAFRNIRIKALGAPPAADREPRSPEAPGLVPLVRDAETLAVIQELQDAGTGPGRGTR